MDVEALSLGVIIVTALILLAAKELAMTNSTEFSTRLSHFLNVPIIIMLVVFGLLLAHGIIEILRTVNP